MFWSAFVILWLAMGLMVLLLLARLRAITRRKHTEALVSVWRPIFTGAVPNAPRYVSPRDAFTVLNLWNDFQRVRSDTHGVPEEALAEIARVQRLDALALKILRRGDAGDRIVALTFAGYRRLGQGLAHVKEFFHDPLGELALAAYRAAVLIDPAELRGFIFEIARHDDWRLQTIERILKELGPGRISRSMAIAAEDSSDDQLLRLLRFFTLCEPSVARGALCDQLTFRKDPEVIAAALRALAPFALPQHRALIHGFLEHPASFVRIAAIGAIVAVSNAEDRDALLRLLGDENSWVRYRAAQTLLDRFTQDQEGDLRREVADQYAKDALTQVLAERSVLELRQFVADEAPTEAEVWHRRGPPRRPMDAMRTRG